MRSIITKSLESYAIGSAVFGVLVAGVLSFIPMLSFGTFWQMAAMFTIADLLVYVAMKTGLLKRYRALRQR
jgi:predicted lipid-binding transport protein (Tim44 family)